jgi:Hsp20/alpha crystallin family protein
MARSSRAFELPASVDRDKVAADFSKGVLTITLPKRRKSRSKPKRSRSKRPERQEPQRTVNLCPAASAPIRGRQAGHEIEMLSFWRAGRLAPDG